MNLVINAYHSMTIMRPQGERYGGLLSINLEKYFPDKRFMDAHNEAQNITYWKLTISDTGVGIPKINMKKIFDPFFTTKEKDQGTGLGLAMTYSILEQHNGFIEVVSKLDAGSVFSIFLPEYISERIIEREEIKIPVRKGSGTILIIDDDPLVRATTSRMLEELGYKVLKAMDGTEGIEIYLNRYTEIKAVILDMVMPRKSGYDVYFELKEINPEAKILLSSGLKTDEKVSKLLEKEVKYFIAKPYSITKLSVILNQVLEDE